MSSRSWTRSSLHNAYGHDSCLWVVLSLVNEWVRKCSTMYSPDNDMPLVDMSRLKDKMCTTILPTHAVAWKLSRAMIYLVTPCELSCTFASRDIISKIIAKSLLTFVSCCRVCIYFSDFPLVLVFSISGLNKLGRRKYITIGFEAFVKVCIVASALTPQCKSLHAFEPSLLLVFIFLPFAHSDKDLHVLRIIRPNRGIWTFFLPFTAHDVRCSQSSLLSSVWLSAYFVIRCSPLPWQSSLRYIQSLV